MAVFLQEGYNLSDATGFFQTIINKPWIKQLALAPHIYCPGVTDATTCYSGQTLFSGLDQSFGYLTVSPGWCSNGTCRVRPLRIFTPEPCFSCATSCSDHSNQDLLVQLPLHGATKTCSAQPCHTQTHRPSLIAQARCNAESRHGQTALKITSAIHPEKSLHN